MTARLTETVLLLKEVRSELRSDVDARVVEALDKAIVLLESEKTAHSRKLALQYIGDALKYVPAIKAIIDELLK